jgi:HAD superfamily hydrolase (TIGR01509 family)
MTRDLRGLLFDFDGTIAETERHAHRVAYNLAFAEHGLDWHWDEVLYGELLSVTGGRERLRHYIGQAHPRLLDAGDVSGLIADLYISKARHFAAIAPTIPLRTGVRRLMHEAHAAGVVIAIVTTARRVGVEAVLEQDATLLPMVSVMADGDVVERKKPAPDVYVRALDQLALRPEQCVAIEDTRIGLTSARGAGVTTLVTVSDYSAGEDFGGASAVLSGLGDVGEPARAIAGPTPATGVVDLAFLRSI